VCDVVASFFLHPGLLEPQRKCPTAREFKVTTASANALGIR
jgi:hypothetical protein